MEVGGALKPELKSSLSIVLMSGSWKVNTCLKHLFKSQSYFPPQNTHTREPFWFCHQIDRTLPVSTLNVAPLTLDPTRLGIQSTPETLCLFVHQFSHWYNVPSKKVLETVSSTEPSPHHTQQLVQVSWGAGGCEGSLDSKKTHTCPQKCKVRNKTLDNCTGPESEENCDPHRDARN